MKPSSRYNEFLQLPEFVVDPLQQSVVQALDELSAEILAFDWPKSNLAGTLIRLFGRQSRPPSGLYLWGGVGRGKTFLMDIFFECLPISDKKRIHFHAFMKMIHDRLGQAGDIKDPLRQIAAQLAADMRVLCLDEFIVTDIGDAMLTAQLLKALFDEGVVLVTTSNSAPPDLYRDGLQRSRFLPAIDLLLEHCTVINLDGEQDYRVLGLKDAALYRFPLDDDADRQLLEYLDHHHVMAQRHGQIEINSRPIAYEYRAEDSIWFTFDSLCMTARSRLDYLEIAQQFGTLVLTGIRQMDNGRNDEARRFISLIDVLYDHRVKLICTAEVAPRSLYTGGRLAAEFERTVSRLMEMQGQEYLHLSHRID